MAATYEYGNTFVIVAGLLNMLAVLDAYDISQGVSDQPPGLMLVFAALVSAPSPCCPATACATRPGSPPGSAPSSAAAYVLGWLLYPLPLSRSRRAWLWGRYSRP